MVAFRNSEVKERAVAALRCHGKADDARGVGLKREGHEIVHQVHMRQVVAGNSVRLRDRSGRQCEALRLPDLLLDAADSGKEFVEFLAVVASEIALETARVFEHEIE